MVMTWYPVLLEDRNSDIKTSKFFPSERFAFRRSEEYPFFFRITHKFKSVPFAAWHPGHTDKNIDDHPIGWIPFAWHPNSADLQPTKHRLHKDHCWKFQVFKNETIWMCWSSKTPPFHACRKVLAKLSRSSCTSVAEAAANAAAERGPRLSRPDLVICKRSLLSSPAVGSSVASVGSSKNSWQELPIWWNPPNPPKKKR